MITKEDIELMKNDDTKIYFPQCEKFITDYKSAQDDETKTKCLEGILQNFAKEKTVYILKTNEELNPVRELIKDKMDSVVDLDSFIKAVIENEEAKATLNKILDSESTTTGTGNTDTGNNSEAETVTGGSGETTTVNAEDGAFEGEEDPWIRNTLSKLRSKNLY